MMACFIYAVLIAACPPRSLALRGTALRSVRLDRSSGHCPLHCHFLRPRGSDPCCSSAPRQDDLLTKRLSGIKAPFLLSEEWSLSAIGRAARHGTPGYFPHAVFPAFCRQGAFHEQVLRCRSRGRRAFYRRPDRRPLKFTTDPPVSPRTRLTKPSKATRFSLPR